jgi:DedD protein
LDERLKKRLVGATVLVSLVVIFVPMLLEEKTRDEPAITGTNIPKRPDIRLSSRVLPLDDEDLAEPPPQPDIEPPPPAEPDTPQVASDDKPPQPESGKKEPAGEAESPDQTETQSEVRVGLSAWVIQAASYSTREKADKAIADLRKSGFEAFLEQAHVNKQDVYRVRIGPELNRRRAEATLARLEKEFKLKGLIVHYP